MSKIKVVSVLGTRPEAIKMIPLINELSKRDDFISYICVTGQHRELLDDVLKSFNIVPDFIFNSIRKSSSLDELTSDILLYVSGVLQEVKPDIVLVHGDTTTAFAASLAAFYLKIDVCHIEAGLRTYDKHSPFPEEMNRKFIDSISELCFAPTNVERDNLLSENIAENKIFVTGNTIIDFIKSNEEFLNKKQKMSSKKTILLTTHRRENIGEKMVNIFEAIKEIVANDNNVEVIFPVHKNPKIRELVSGTLSSDENIKIIEPLNVIEFYKLLSNVDLILTDSGGIQEEAVTSGIPVFVLRDSTERKISASVNTLKVIGTDKKRILKEVNSFFKCSGIIDCQPSSYFGDGKASIRILDIIKNKYEKR